MSSARDRPATGIDVTDLVAAARAGNEGAFQTLAGRYRHGIYAVCLDRTGDFDLAEDLTQEALLRAHAQLHTLREPAAFPAWLRQIALNCCRAWQRRAWPEAVAVDPDACPQLTTDVFREAMRREAAREIRAALARLPENNRLAVIMFYVRGNTYREIAEFLNIPESTVLGRLYRARSQLRSLLEARIRDDLAAETSERKVDEPR